MNWDQLEKDVIEATTTPYSTMDQGVGELEMLRHQHQQLQEAFARLCVQLAKGGYLTKGDIDYL